MNAGAIIVFFAGILVQAVLLPLGKLSPKDLATILLCCAGSAFGLIPGRHEHNYSLSFHLFCVACIFAVAYAACFKEKILERINKEVLLVWTLVGLYIALEIPLVVATPALSFPLFVLSLIAVVNAFAGFDRNYGWKVYFYIWFLCIIIGVIASQFAFSTVSAVFGFGHGAAQINPLMIFVIGMSFLYLAVNLWYVFEIIPIPGKNQSFSERLEQVEEDLEIMAEDYDAEQVRWWKTLALLVFCTSLLAANYFRHFVADTVIIPLLIAALPVLHKFDFTKTSAAPASEAPPDIVAGKLDDDK